MIKAYEADAWRDAYHFVAPSTNKPTVESFSAVTPRVARNSAGFCSAVEQTEARKSHKLEVAGSNPACATTFPHWSGSVGQLPPSKPLGHSPSGELPPCSAIASGPLSRTSLTAFGWPVRTLPIGIAGLGCASSAVNWSTGQKHTELTETAGFTAAALVVTKALPHYPVALSKNGRSGALIRRSFRSSACPTEAQEALRAQLRRRDHKGPSESQTATSPRMDQPAGCSVVAHSIGSHKALRPPVSQPHRPSPEAQNSRADLMSVETGIAGYSAVSSSA